MPAKLDEIDLELKAAIAKRLKQLREETGQTQEGFAYSGGRDKQSLSKNERGMGATIYTINKFCIERGITLTDFFNSSLFKNLIPLKKKKL